MSDLILLPDAEQTIGKHLRDHPDVVALGTRVAGKIPAQLAMPWVRLTQINATDMSGGRDYFIDWHLQHDCYAGDSAMQAHSGQKEAWLVARTVRAVLAALKNQVLDGLVVSDVQFTNMGRIPDVGFEPARERIVLDARIYGHRA